MAREIEARDDTTTTTNTTGSAMMPLQITDINAVVFPKVDASVGRDVCVGACEVTCNSTVLALIQSTCLSKCVGGLFRYRSTVSIQTRSTIC